MLNNKNYTKMKTLKVNEETFVITVNKMEVITLCTALMHLSVDRLKIQKGYSSYKYIRELYNNLFEYQL